MTDGSIFSRQSMILRAGTVNHLNTIGKPLTRKDLRTPRAAAAAGIIFALLLGTGIVLVYTSIPMAPLSEAAWLANETRRVSLTVAIIPFAGIAFLYFIGVIRDQVGELEDQFFSTVFLGSGLLFLSGLFVWLGVMGSVLVSYAEAPDTWAGSDAYLFGRAMIQVMGGTVVLRMAGVFMLSSAAIWSRTKVMPRWVVLLTFVTALAMLIGGSSLHLLRLAFPVWVFLISLFLLGAGRGELIHETAPEESVDSEAAKNNRDEPIDNRI